MVDTWGIRTPNFSVQTRYDTRFHYRPINSHCNSVKIRFTASNVANSLNNLEAQSKIIMLSFSFNDARTSGFNVQASRLKLPRLRLVEQRNLYSTECGSHDQIIQLSKNYSIYSTDMVYCIKFMQTWLQLFSTIFHIDLLSHSTQSINIYYYIKSCIHGHNYFFNNFPTSVVKERICESETSELSLLYLHHKIYYNKTSSRWSLINKNSQNFF